MQQYNVTGMSCAACSARVEKAVGKVEGVTSCSVSLLTNSMGVEGTATDEAIIAAVVEAGYGATVKGASKEKNMTSESQELSESDKEIKILKNHSNSSFFRRKVRNIIFSKENLTACGLLQTAQKIQCRTFSASGGAKQADQLTVGELKGEVVDRHHLLARLLAARGEYLGEILQYNFHVRIILPECSLFSKKLK